jgi:hypothetical protein
MNLGTFYTSSTVNVITEIITPTALQGNSMRLNMTEIVKRLRIKISNCLKD